jgi:hypothetical protein
LSAKCDCHRKGSQSSEKLSENPSQSPANLATLEVLDDFLPLKNLRQKLFSFPFGIKFLSLFSESSVILCRKPSLKCILDESRDFADTHRIVKNSPAAHRTVGYDEKNRTKRVGKIK